MTPDRLRWRLNELGLSQKGLARCLGHNYRTVRRWTAGQNAIPEGLETDMDAITPEDVERAMGQSR